MEITPKLVILFGSQVSGHTHLNSDYDVAILAKEHLTLDLKNELCDALAKRLSTSPHLVDIVDIRAASPLLKRVIADGKLLIGSEDEFLKFKLSAWREYIDTAKFRMFRSRSLKESIA
ncbi:MAG: hypothetical protein A2758_03125 [Candidatus Zambryskibacteria bacterium RIFCSPHIGHO2_01_FULL_49_18]|uniref:Polymerase beta nucleotidyltransferase domain-containing protein n=2 Tax=Parcubacteria group TaxID=1794811 RepID=A0A1G2T3R6_9BACT|nr:MAG: hypothetical protein A2941_02270 [Candidatus Yanofskybacteria bacterium RIFCSPLOWO2_01_FULL_49_17]OHA91772.1 MAG: hypothetical protein A2758_03125 [Candidatus Zambryskibacteria bacterium RIFCSPHIGHO2_01_FULL_49_18]